MTNDFANQVAIGAINKMIADSKDDGADVSQVSDGYHTFDEIYRHRNLLFAALLNSIDNTNYTQCWKSKKTNDGKEEQGWFLAGIILPNDEQISYHLPVYLWDIINSKCERDFAPAWDGHTSDNVLDRLEQYNEFYLK